MILGIVDTILSKLIETLRQETPQPVIRINIEIEIVTDWFRSFSEFDVVTDEFHNKNPERGPISKLDIG